MNGFFSESKGIKAKQSHSAGALTFAIFVLLQRGQCISITSINWSNSSIQRKGQHNLQKNSHEFTWLIISRVLVPAIVSVIVTLLITR